jgi:hypothetical protein
MDQRDIKSRAQHAARLILSNPPIFRRFSENSETMIWWQPRILRLRFGIRCPRVDLGLQQA